MVVAVVTLHICPAVEEPVVNARFANGPIPLLLHCGIVVLQESQLGAVVAQLRAVEFARLRLSVCGFGFVEPVGQNRVKYHLTITNWTGT